MREVISSLLCTDQVSQAELPGCPRSPPQALSHHPTCSFQVPLLPTLPILKLPAGLALCVEVPAASSLVAPRARVGVPTEVVSKWGLS